MLDIVLRIAYLLAISLSLCTSGWLIVKADKNRTTGALAVCQFLIIIWCIPQLFSSLPMTKGMKYLAYGISYVGISFIGPAWLEFAFLYSKRKLGHLAECFLFGAGAVNYSVLLTNEYHHLFYLRFEVEQVIYGPVFYIHMVYTYVCVLAGMAVVLWAFQKNRVALAHIVVILLSAAVPLGFNLLYMTGLVRIGFDLTPPAFALSSILMLLAVFRYDFLDVNTLAFDKIFDSIAEGVVVYNKRGKITYSNRAVSRWFGWQAGDGVAQLRELLIENDIAVDSEGLLSGRCREGMAEKSSSLSRTIEGQGTEKRTIEGREIEKRTIEGQGTEDQTVEGQGTEDQTVEGRTIEGQTVEDQAIEGQKIEDQTIGGRTIEGRETEGQPIEKQTIESRPVNRRGQSYGDMREPVITLKQGNDICKLEVKQYTYRDKKGEIIAGTVMFTDVGRYYQLLEQGEALAVSNQRLAIEQERNRIAQEVHDTAGHTLTMINSLIKLIRIEYEKNGSAGEEVHIEEYLRQAQELAGSGIRELRCSINNLRQSAACGLITQGVYQLARSVKEFEVEVEIQGEDRQEYSHLSLVVYECLREAITNCLKYAHASHMDVILKFSSDCLNLYIFDNGKGCGGIQEGNGIRGIRERVAQAGGKVRIISGSGEGFQIYIRLPL